MDNLTDVSSGADTGVDTAGADGGMADGSNTEPSNQPNTTAEELYEVAYGKDNSGNPLIKKFSKADLIKHAGLGLSAHEKTTQVNQRAAQVEQLIKALRHKEGFWQIAKSLGHDPDEFMKEFVDQKIAESLEDPKDRELRTTKQELEQFRKDKASREKAAEDQKTAELTEQYTRDIGTKINEALKTAKIPNTEDNRAAVATYLNSLLEQNVNPLEAPLDKIVSHLKKSRLDGFQSLITDADDDALLALLPEDVLERIAKAASKKYSAKSGKVDNTINNPAAAEPAVKERKVMTTAEAEKELKKKLAAAQVAFERRQAKK